MRAYNKKHKRKHTTKVKIKKYEWNIKTGYEVHFLLSKKVSIKHSNKVIIVRYNHIKNMEVIK